MTSAPFTPPPYIGHESWNFEMGKWIDRTKTGLLLLLVGTVIAVIPFIGFIGTILAAIGALLVILGRRAFGSKHSKYVLFSVGIYCFGFIVVFFAALIFAVSIVTARAATSQSELIQIVTSALNSLIIGAVIGGAITSFSYVLFTYAIQNQIGRILLWTAYGISLAIEAALFLIFTPLIASTISASFTSSGTYNPQPLRDLQGQISSFGLLSLLPYGLYATAYYIVYSRVNRGEIPPRTTTQPPPSPPMPPTM